MSTNGTQTIQPRGLPLNGRLRKIPPDVPQEAHSLFARECGGRGVLYLEGGGEAVGDVQRPQGSRNRDSGERKLCGEGCLAGQLIWMATAATTKERLFPVAH